jgi:hypothetical protein
MDMLGCRVQVFVNVIFSLPLHALSRFFISPPPSQSHLPLVFPMHGTCLTISLFPHLGMQSNQHSALGGGA